MPGIYETAIELHRELSRRGLELNPEIGRDAALHSALATKLKLPSAGFSRALERSKLSAEDYLRALVDIAQPFAQMFQKIWSYLSRHCAPKAGENISVRFGFEGEGQTEINWDQFRVMIESTQKVWAMGPVLLWPREELFSLGNIFHRHAGPWPEDDHYERGKSYTLPVVHVLGVEDKVAERVREAIQSWIDTVQAAWPLENQNYRDVPELEEPDSAQNYEADAHRTLLTLSYMLTDLVPIWRRILTNWEIIPPSVKEAAASFFVKEIGPKLRTSIRGGWRSLLEALDILDLPFWRHRWHTYEVWAAVVALEALDEFRPLPVVKCGYIAIDAASPALIATLTGAKRHIFAHVQGETKLSLPFGKRKAIKPDLRFSLDNPVTNEGTIAIVEFKQRRVLDVAHVSEVLAAYSLGVGLRGGVVVINYDSAPKVAAPERCVLLGDVHPGMPSKVKEFQIALRRCFANASIIPPLAKRIVLLDVSGSMGSEYGTAASQRGLKRLLATLWVKVFRFNDGLVTGGDLKAGSQIATSGGTELGAALQQLFNLPDVGVPERLLIVTDGGHDHPDELLAKIGEHIECLPEDLDERLNWLTME